MDKLIHLMMWYERESHDNDFDEQHFKDWLSDYQDTYPEKYNTLMTSLDPFFWK